MNTQRIKNSAKLILYKSTLVYALSISIGAISGFNMASVLVTGIFATIACKIDYETSLLPIISSFLITMFSLNKIGLSLSLISFAISGLLTLFLSKVKVIKIAIKSPEFISAIMLSVALTITVLITTDYFAIGATGNTNIEMIKSYVSLGFHPNWRSILYGTIVMVVMITFPRKFKNATKIISAPFLALVISWLINFALIPPSSIINPVKMLEKPVFRIESIKNFWNFQDINLVKIIYILAIAFAICLCFLMTFKNESDGNKSIFPILSPALFGYTLPAPEIKTTYEFVCGISSALSFGIVMIITQCFNRLPVSSCAVLLIVGTWQAFDGKQLKLAFKNYKTIIIFFMTTIITMLTNIAVGLIFGILFVIIKNITTPKNCINQ